MRLTKILTPEIVLGTRGSEDDIKFYKMYLNAISKIGPGMECGPPVLNMDQITQTHFALCWKFRKQGGGKVFHIGRDFAHAMAGIEKDIPVDKLPDKFFAYFSFPENTFTQFESSSVKGGFIYIGPAKETTMRLGQNAEYNATLESKVVWLNYECDVPEAMKRANPDMRLWQTCKFMMGLDNGTQAALDLAPQLPDSDKASTDVARAFINLALYIHSADPDLLPTRAVQQQSIKERKKFFVDNGVANHCTLPVTFVSWNYKQPFVYHKDMTTVRAHYRWQPCGPGFSQVKLVLIEEHERHFKPGEPEPV